MNKNLELLRVIDEGVAGETGDGFFRSLVTSMARALEVVNAFACEFNADRSMALFFAEWAQGALVTDSPPFAIEGTPCQLTLTGDIVAFEDHVSDRFPYLRDVQAESYLAIPLKTNAAEVVGHLAAIDTRPRHWGETDFGILRIFAARAATEIERRRYERDLEGAKRQAEHASHAKTQFLAYMSHEIRTPLNAIFGYTQLLARGNDLSRAQTHAIQEITNASEHLLGLINELLDIAKIESGNADLVLEPVDLKACLAHALEVGRLRAEQVGLGFVFEAPSDWPPRLLIDERKLRQVVLNLLNNAVQFTARGGVTLTLSVERMGGASFRILLRVRDTGIGLGHLERARIFEPFFRTDDGRRMADGSGLGLAIVQRLVAMMGGTVAVTSNAGHGSEFVVDFMAEAAEPVDFDSPPRRSRIIGHAGPARTVLVADDARESRSVLRELLVSLGFKVLEAANGEEALAIARACHPDLIFMDLVMPGLDGYEAVRRIRATDAVTDTPIIALSASALEDTWQLSANNGCNGFLSKPVRFEQIIDSLQRHLDLHWIHAPSATDSVMESATRPHGKDFLALGVTAAEIGGLFELAQLGDIVGVGKVVDRLGAGPGVDDEFTNILRNLMSRYDMRAIREFLRPMLP